MPVESWDPVCTECQGKGDQSCNLLSVSVTLCIAQQILHSGVKQVTAIPRQEPSRPKAKSRPASAVLPRQPGQPALAVHAASAGVHPSMLHPAVAAGSLPADTQAKLPAQGLPFPASTGTQGSPMSSNMKLTALRQLPHSHDVVTLRQVNVHGIHAQEK